MKPSSNNKIHVQIMKFTCCLFMFFKFKKKSALRAMLCLRDTTILYVAVLVQKCVKDFFKINLVLVFMKVFREMMSLISMYMYEMAVAQGFLRIFRKFLS